MIEEIKSYIWSFCTDKDTHSFTNEGKEINGIEDVINLAEEKFNVEIEFREVGDFTSCGYDMFCYSWACIMPNGELYFDSCCHESY